MSETNINEIAKKAGKAIVLEKVIKDSNEKI